MGSRTRSPRHHPTTILAALGALALALVVFILSAGPANAAQESETEVDSEAPTLRGVGPNGFVDVIEVNGLLDPVLVNFIDRSLDESLELGARAVVLQMESAGAAVDDDELSALATRVAEFPIPVSVWMGPAGKGRALGGAGQLAIASTRIGISPGSEIGDFGASVLEGSAATGPFVSLLDGGFSGETVGYDELLQFRANDGDLPIQDAPTLLIHLLELPEFDFTVYQPGETIPMARWSRTNRSVFRRPTPGS